MTAFEAMLASAQQGDEHAFAELFRLAQPRALRYAGLLAPGAGEDVTAEAWIDVVRGLHRFIGSEAAFRGWVMTCVRHRAIDWARARGRRPVELQGEVSEPERRGQPGAGTGAHDEIETLIDAGRNPHSALALLRHLPPEQAEVVWLRAVAGLDVAAVADLVGRSPGAVRVSAHRGLRRLAELLDGRPLPEGALG